MTATRDAARLLATREALAGWASGQAEFISQNFADGAYQAAAAEVILECGGDIGNLKIVRRGNQWLNTSEIARYLTSISVLHISFDGEFDFEDYDPVSPSDFKDRFEINHDVAIVLNNDGSLFYPNDFTSDDHLTVNGGFRRLSAARYVRSLIMNIWGEQTEELDEERVVGTVYGEEIIRTISAFRRPVAAIDLLAEEEGPLIIEPLSVDLTRSPGRRALNLRIPAIRHVGGGPAIRRKTARTNGRRGSHYQTCELLSVMSSLLGLPGRRPTDPRVGRG